MITSDEARRIATEVIGPASAGDGQGWQLEEFDAGWLVREDWMSEQSVRGGSFCVIEKAAGRVLAFPSSISPARIKAEYDQVVERASPVSDLARPHSARPGWAGRAPGVDAAAALSRLPLPLAGTGGCARWCHLALVGVPEGPRLAPGQVGAGGVAERVPYPETGTSCHTPPLRLMLLPLAWPGALSAM